MLPSVREGKWNTFLSSIKDRSSCDPSCGFASSCPMTVYAPKCLVLDLKPDEKIRFFNIFLFGEQGLRNEIGVTLFNFSKNLHTEEDPDHAERYLEALLKVNRQIYGEKSRQKPMPENLVISMNVSSPQKQPQPLLILEEEAVGADEQSLFTSPDLDKIAKTKKMSKND